MRKEMKELINIIVVSVEKHIPSSFGLKRAA